MVSYVIRAKGRPVKELPNSSLKELAAYLKECRTTRHPVIGLTVKTEPYRYVSQE